MYTIEIIRDLDGLLADSTAWNRIACGVPFRETSWLGPWWQHFGHDLEPFAITARDGEGILQGLLPLYRYDCGSAGKSLSVIGDGEACSDFVSVLALPDLAVEIAAEMGRFLVECSTDGQDGWNQIDIDGVSECDPVMVALARGLQQSGATVHSQSRMSSWFRKCDQSWEDHIKRHGKTQRRKLRKWSKRIETTDGLERHRVGEEKELKNSLNSLIDLHQNRWTECGEPGTFADKTFESFIRAACADFFSREKLYLPTLTMDEKVIGAELHFVGGDRRLYCYSSGFDTAAAELEPGRVLHVDTLMRLYEANLDGIDFLRGDEPYKERAGAEPTKVLRMRVAAPALLPRLRHAVWWTGFEVKQFMRRKTGRTPIAVVDMPAAGDIPVVSN